jgi:hypothetical protein
VAPSARSGAAAKSTLTPIRSNSLDGIGIDDVLAASVSINAAILTNVSS